MNFLAHAYLSFGDREILTGNMIGDHVKGLKALDAMPPRVAAGIRLHRAIDAMADTHPAVMRSKVWFRDPYRLYAGAVLDTLWDHFLTNDPQAFGSNAELKAFTSRTYAQLEATTAWQPASFQRILPHMKEHDWLANYRNLRGMQRALGGLSRRAPNMPPPEAAYEIFIRRYHQLSQAYFELIDSLRQMAAAALEQA